MKRMKRKKKMLRGNKEEVKKEESGLKVDVKIK